MVKLFLTILQWSNYYLLYYIGQTITHYNFITLVKVLRTLLNWRNNIVELLLTITLIGKQYCRTTTSYITLIGRSSIVELLLSIFIRSIAQLV